jgi:polyhydroxyalkanoate synthesis regulator phasin
MKKWLLIFAAVGALALGVVAVAAAGAQEGVRPADRFIAKVADKLGISEDDLTTAMKDAQLELIDERVAEGALSETQAAKLKERIEEYGPLSILKGPRGDHRRCLAARFTVEAAAEVLGMEREALVEALKSPMSLAQVAGEQGMSVDDFKAALLSQVQTRLQSLVDDGKLTREQSDDMFQRFSDHVDEIINFVPREGGPGPCRPHHGPPPAGAPGPGDAAPPPPEF